MALQALALEAGRCWPCAVHRAAGRQFALPTSLDLLSADFGHSPQVVAVAVNSGLVTYPVGVTKAYATGDLTIWAPHAAQGLRGDGLHRIPRRRAAPADGGGVLLCPCRDVASQLFGEDAGGQTRALSSDVAVRSGSNGLMACCDMPHSFCSALSCLPMHQSASGTASLELLRAEQGW